VSEPTTAPAEPPLDSLPTPPPAPRRARLRALTGLTLLGAMVGGVWAFGYWEPRLLPVRTIEVQGELHHHSSELLRETLGQRLQGGFLTADLNDLKRAAEGLPWVGGASIRRVWPDRLQVRVLEHRPVARWKGDGLVTAEGVVFRPRGQVPAGLPLLEGDEARARELVERYLKWRDALMLAGQLIDTLGVDARGAWHLDLVSNTRVELGTNDIERRLMRFIAAVPQLEAAGRARVVDLRYSNGFAVKWAGSAVAAAPEPVPPKTAPPTHTKARKKGATANTATKQTRTPTQAQRPAAAKERPRPRTVAAPTKARAQTPPPPRHPPPTLARAPARALTQAVPGRP
jgi:cell division protein FtsQ